MQNMSTTGSVAVSVWSDAELNRAKWADVPESARGRWTLVMLRGGLLQLARVADVQRSPMAVVIARALRAAAEALVE